MTKYKIQIARGNVSPSGKEYSRTVGGYDTKWRVGRNSDSRIVSEKVLRVNIRRK